jgi:hypothetical protein
MLASGKGDHTKICSTINQKPRQQIAIGPVDFHDRGCRTSFRMIWRPPGEFGGVTNASVIFIDAAPIVRRRHRRYYRWSREASTGLILCTAVGIALQHPHRRVATNRVLGRRPLHPRGGQGHQLDFTGSPHRRDASNGCGRA